MTFVVKLRWFFKQRFLAYSAAILLMVTTNILLIIPPRIIGNVIDQAKSGQLTPEMLNRSIAILIGLAINDYILFFIWLVLLFGSAILLEKLLRQRLLTHLTKMTPSFFQRNRTGELMALSTNDIPAISQTAGYGMLTLVSTIVGLTTVITAMIIFVDITLMLAALIPMPFIALAVNRLGKAMRRRFLIAQQSFAQLNDHALESISGLRVIRSYVQEDHDNQAFEQVATDVMDKNIAVAKINALFQPVISTIVGLSFAIGIGYGSYLVFHSHITLGQLFTFNIYLGQLIWPIFSFGEFINVLQRGNASVDRLETALEQQPDVQNSEELIDVPVPTCIEIKQLSFRYPGATTDSLRDISLRIERGQTLGIVGRTGSGKSTLLKLLLRQYPLEAQKIWIAGVPIENIALDRLRQWIGYVPQEHLLLSKTVKENIMFGKPDATDEEVWKAIEMASFTKDLQQMAEGWDTLIGESGVMLSGGQKQRTAIARALLINPEILILDDVLSAVDAKTETTILNHIKRERGDKTTLIASHRLSAVSHAHWIIVLENGRIIEEGTHEQLMSLNGWYTKQYERQHLESLVMGEGDAP